MRQCHHWWVGKASKPTGEVWRLSRKLDYHLSGSRPRKGKWRRVNQRVCARTYRGLERTETVERVESEEQTGAPMGSLPRMRPVGDVVNRIMYDDSFDAEHFVVGYTDRFEGVLERAFTEFNWVSALCDVRLEELAVPHHRVVYFKYNGLLVWDRRTRTDNIFGSSGDAQLKFDYVREHFLELLREQMRANGELDEDDELDRNFE